MGRQPGRKSTDRDNVRSPRASAQHARHARCGRPAGQASTTRAFRHRPAQARVERPSHSARGSSSRVGVSLLRTSTPAFGEKTDRRALCPLHQLYGHPDERRSRDSCARRSPKVWSRGRRRVARRAGIGRRAPTVACRIELVSHSSYPPSPLLARSRRRRPSPTARRGRPARARRSRPARAEGRNSASRSELQSLDHALRRTVGSVWLTPGARDGSGGAAIRARYGR
jgi:hypothetical protein